MCAPENGARSKSRNGNDARRCHPNAQHIATIQTCKLCRYEKNLRSVTNSSCGRGPGLTCEANLAGGGKRHSMSCSLRHPPHAAIGSITNLYHFATRHSRHSQFLPRGARRTLTVGTTRPTDPPRGARRNFGVSERSDRPTLDCVQRGGDLLNRKCPTDRPTFRLIWYAD